MPDLAGMLQGVGAVTGYASLSLLVGTVLVLLVTTVFPPVSLMDGQDFS